MDTSYSSQEMCNFGTPLFKIFSGKYRDNIVGNFSSEFFGIKYFHKFNKEIC